MTSLEATVAEVTTLLRSGFETTVGQLAQHQLDRQMGSPAEKSDSQPRVAPPMEAQENPDDLEALVIAGLEKWKAFWGALENRIVIESEDSGNNDHQTAFPTTALFPQLMKNTAGLVEALQGWDGLQSQLRFVLTTSGAVGAITASIRCFGAFSDLPPSATQETVQTALRMFQISEQELVPVSAEVGTPTTTVHYGAMSSMEDLRSAVSVSMACSQIADPLGQVALLKGVKLVERHLQAFWRTYFTQMLLPDYLGAKWTASSKFMGGRNISHSVVFMNMMLLKQLRHLREEGLWNSWAPFVIAIVAYEFSECFLEIQCSEARTHQLKADVLYFTRFIRHLRGIYLGKRFPVGATVCSSLPAINTAAVVDHFLLKAIAAVSLRATPLEPMSKWWGGGNAASSDETNVVSGDFLNHVWFPPAFDVRPHGPFFPSTEALATIGGVPSFSVNLAQLYQPLSPIAHPSVALPIAHDAFSKIEIPAPTTPINILAAHGAAEDRASMSVLRLKKDLSGQGETTRHLWQFVMTTSTGSNGLDGSANSNGLQVERHSMSLLSNTIQKRWEMWDSYPVLEDEEKPFVETLRGPKKVE